ncbi:MAG: phosphatase PAP2 family protein [Chloroflexi bacterium]|nr:phosphatase PAP2 family protein [Chloroflexota bacterium]
MNLDWTMFLAINQFAGQSQVLDALGELFAEYAFLLYALLLAGLWFLPAAVALRRERQQRVLNAIGALAGALLSAHLIGVFFYRARPFVTHSVTQLIPYTPDASFPSDHTTLAFALIIALWLVLGRTRLFCLGLAALIGLARVFVGLHYPTDVLGGAVLGAAWGALAIVAASRLRRIEQPLLERLARWRLA